MAGFSVGKLRMQKRNQKRQSLLDDILVFDEDIPREARLSFVDFAPTVKHTIDGYDKSVDFYALVDYANKWLERTGSRWDVVNCETVPGVTIQLSIGDGGETVGKQILTRRRLNKLADLNSLPGGSVPPGRHVLHFRVTMLRLWIRSSAAQYAQQQHNHRISLQFNDRPEQQVVVVTDSCGGNDKSFEMTAVDEVVSRPVVNNDQPINGCTAGQTDDQNNSLPPVLQYRDFIPKLVDKDRHQFESVDDVIKRLNHAINNQEFNGKILNIQTLAFRAGNQWQVNTETTGQSRPLIEVGFADFIPQCLSGGSIFKRPVFESQQFILEKASKWLSDNPEINYCSAVSMDVKLKSMVSINTKQMSAIRETGDYIRILRLAYTKPRDVPVDIPESSATLPPPPPVYLESQSFVVYKSYAEVKRLVNEFMASRQEWSRDVPDQYRWSLFSCETVPVFSVNNLKQSLETNSDQSFQAILSTSRSINRSEYFAVKIYFDVGYYGVDHQLPDKQGLPSPAPAAAAAVDTPTSTTSAADDGSSNSSDGSGGNDDDKQKTCTIM
ncbi:uncharacterized protein LOC128962087 [Oppia nitens]|uniref:uncharacterized protein LOC128962087 n=1 Tax=Oppia nitens TaxID=1686743 RepID=UPI0023DADF44|nr:uncharacterized protein LOC128962087 [Oppia nitens]